MTKAYCNGCKNQFACKSPRFYFLGIFLYFLTERQKKVLSVYLDDISTAADETLLFVSRYLLFSISTNTTESTAIASEAFGGIPEGAEKANLYGINLNMYPTCQNRNFFFGAQKYAVCHPGNRAAGM
jgi:hypothetical protein